MNTNIRGPDRPHLVGESATHPIEPRCGALAALLALQAAAGEGARPLARHKPPSGRLVSGLGLADMSQSPRLWPSPDTNSPYGLFVSGLSP